MNDTSRDSTSPPIIDINIDNDQFAMIMTNNQHIARVGPLGFMCLPDDEIPGNAGLLDQVSSDGLFGTASRIALEKSYLPNILNLIDHIFTNYFKPPCIFANCLDPLPKILDLFHHV